MSFVCGDEVEIWIESENTWKPAIYNNIYFDKCSLVKYMGILYIVQNEDIRIIPKLDKGNPNRTFKERFKG